MYLHHHNIRHQKKRSKTCSNGPILDGSSAVESVLVQARTADKYEMLNIQEIHVRVVPEMNVQIGGAECPNWRCPSSSCIVATNACTNVPSIEKWLSIPSLIQLLHLFMGVSPIEGSGMLRSQIILF